jgi:hypothetical protein
MAQSALATKTAITISGTAGPSLAAAGRDGKGVLLWRDLTNSAPLSQNVLSQKSDLVNNQDWKSTTIFKIPSMESVAANGDSEGYVAADKVAAYSYIEIRVTRSARLSNAAAELSWEQFCSAIENNASLKSGLLGYVPADS